MGACHAIPASGQAAWRGAVPCIGRPEAGRSSRVPRHHQHLSPLTMKITLALCAALLFVVVVQAKEEISCKPGTTFKVECNICQCSLEGKPDVCTLMSCPIKRKRASLTYSLPPPWRAKDGVQRQSASTRSLSRRDFDQEYSREERAALRSTPPVPVHPKEGVRRLSASLTPKAVRGLASLTYSLPPPWRAKDGVQRQSASTRSLSRRDLDQEYSREERAALRSTPPVPVHPKEGVRRLSASLTPKAVRGLAQMSGRAARATLTHTPPPPFRLKDAVRRQSATKSPSSARVLDQEYRREERAAMPRTLQPLMHPN